MEVLKAARRFPFVSYGVVALLAHLLLHVLYSLGEGYDDGGFGLLAVLLTPVVSFIALPFTLAIELLFILNGGELSGGLYALAYVLGFLFIGAAELLWQRHRARRASTGVA